MKLQASLVLLTTILCSGCVVRGGVAFDDSEDHTGRLLGTVRLSEEETGRYVLRSNSDGAPSVSRSVQRSYGVAHIGVNVSSVDRTLGAKFGIEAWKGVFVDFVAEESAAARAGFREGDLLLELGGTQMTSREQLVAIVTDELGPNVEISAVVSRARANGERERLKLSLIPGVRVVKESTAEVIPLGFEPWIAEHAGMQIGTVSAELAREIWSTDEARIYVGRVQLGSPAYRAGIRQGDRIVACDGTQVNTTDQVLVALQAITGQHLVSVVGQDGEHEAQLEIAGSIKDDSSFYIPIIIDHSSRSDRTQTSFLDFIFQFGFNYKSKYLRTESRETARSTSLSIFPLGMFEFERSPTKSKNTLFWFITWRTGH